MKCLLAVMLALILLTGCGVDTPEDTAVTTAQTEAAAESVELHALPLEQSGVGLLRMGNNLLLFCEGEQTTLAVVSGSTGEETAQITLDGAIRWDSPAVAAGQWGVSYYDGEARSVVTLDTTLRETSRVPVSVELDGTPALSPDALTLYYCTGSQIRALDLQTGQTRLLKTQDILAQELTGCCFEGQVLTCYVTEADGDAYTAFLSTENGETLGVSETVTQVYTNGQSYLVCRQEGISHQLLFGLDGEAPQRLLANGNAAALLSGGVAVMLEENTQGISLSGYDLYSGKKTALLEMAGADLGGSFAECAGKLWFLSADGSVLYGWDASKSPVESDAVFTGKWYTAEDPDTQGLDACRSQAAALGETYGVDIRIWEEALEPACGYPVTGEYQTDVIQTGLEALEDALSRYPETFFEMAAGDTASGMLHVNLVRALGEGVTGVQFWSEGDAWLTLAIGEDLQRTVYHEVNHLIDTYVISRTVDYDDWESLNPEGFAYTYTEETEQSLKENQYLQGDTRAFIDARSMTYPKEDRAAIMEYAMLPEGAEYFTAEVLQDKLRVMCEAIREAFGWQDVQEQFLWEQYLKAE